MSTDAAHRRPVHRPVPLPADVIAARLEVVADEYAARAAWFRARAASWRTWNPA